MYIHIGVGSDVVCSTLIGNARASVRGMGNKTIPRSFVSVLEAHNKYKNTDMNTLSNVSTRRGETNPPDTGFNSGVNPEAQGLPTGGR